MYFTSNDKENSMLLAHEQANITEYNSGKLKDRY